MEEERQATIVGRKVSTRLGLDASSANDSRAVTYLLTYLVIVRVDSN